ncbi:DUF2179 domain-containing protein [Bacillus taeanensis]|uniref:UPF0316 protein DS031_13515 n=1 Tax=Bacillus taeanensis TaxID=273032 RepID=A0A366XUY7_9BACI|nr:DUF2179 domain-containing protein [Bacillus taeanensis]RBW68955.1 hypothetical protein DS031_13515 [Bacillus taeanensis]
MLNLLLIFVLQVVYIALNTLRIVFVVKNIMTLASLLGFLEMLVYVFGLGIVLNNPTLLGMIIYALGFAAGIYVGGYIEQKLAIGYITVSVNIPNKNYELIECLRNEGFGVTVFNGEGRDSIRYHLKILAKRSREEVLLKLIDDHEPRAFIISYEPRKFKGGFLLKVMKKRMKKQQTY